MQNRAAGQVLDLVNQGPYFETMYIMRPSKLGKISILALEFLSVRLLVPGYDSFFH